MQGRQEKQRWEEFLVRMIRRRPQSVSGARENVFFLCRGILLGVVSWLLSRSDLVFTVNPMGLSLLCASEIHLGWIFAGGLIGAWQRGTFFPLYAGAYTLALLLRLTIHFFLRMPGEDRETKREWRRAYGRKYRAWFYRICMRGDDRYRETAGAEAAEKDDLPPLFREAPYLRMAVALISSLLPGLGIPIAGGFAYYDLYGAVLYLLLASVMTALYAGALIPAAGREENLPGMLPTAVLFLSVCYCGREMILLGMAPVVILTVFLLFSAVRRYGLLGGVVISVLGGLPYMPITVFPYLCLAVLYALVQPIVGEISILLSAFGGWICCLFLGGTPMFWAVAPSIAVGALLFSVCLTLLRRQKEERLAQKGRSEEESATLEALTLEQNRTSVMEERLSAIAGAFGGLSEIFRQLGDSMGRPEFSELRQLCDEAYDRYCPDCPQKEVCWSSAYPDTLECLNRLSEAMGSGKAAGEEVLTEAMRQRCPHTAGILGEINYRNARRSYDFLHGERSELLSQSYQAISGLMRDVLHESGEAMGGEPELAVQVAQYLREKGVAFRHVTVCGKNRMKIQLLGISPAALTVPEGEFRENMERMCGVRLSRPHFDGTGEGTITLRSLPRLRADYVHRSLSSAEETITRGKRGICGDTVRIFQDGGAMFYVLLCDGMGSGRGAALTSGICAVFLERVLRAGVSVSTALGMLNQHLRARTASPEQEYCSSVDLLALDLYTGKARLMKSGAAPTLVLRGNQLYQLAAHTVPIGILSAVDVQVIPFDIQPGDHVLMMSDGISDGAMAYDGEERAGWLTDYLSGDLPFDDGTLIDALLRKAREHGSRDDLSVISVRISEEQ